MCATHVDKLNHDHKFIIKLCSMSIYTCIDFALIPIRVITLTAQGWVNSLLFIFLSAEMRNRMFVYPFRRLIRSAMKSVDITGDSNDSTTAPPPGVTENTPSIRARARLEDVTYYSIPTEFPTQNTAS